MTETIRSGDGQLPHGIPSHLGQLSYDPETDAVLLGTKRGPVEVVTKKWDEPAPKLSVAEKAERAEARAEARDAKDEAKAKAERAEARVAAKAKDERDAKSGARKEPATMVVPDKPEPAPTPERMPEPRTDGDTYSFPENANRYRPSDDPTRPLE